MTTPTAAELLARAKLNIAGAGANPTPESKPETVEKEFSHYKSSRPAVRLITPTGIRIKFVNFELLTEEEAVIEYLDAELKVNGLPGISKMTEKVTLSDRDPMKRLEKELRIKIKAELRQEAIDLAEGKTRDMGKTEQTGLNVLSSSDVAN